MQGIQSAEPKEQEVADAYGASDQPILVVRGNDKAAEDKKEIDGKPRVRHDRQLSNVRIHRDVKQRPEMK